ncbi:MAG TPA: cytochrome c3 family protein [Acidobacteriota bacterium]|nr:cytochrome c3 family protein [Acidobacteriota bacterium]
MSRSGVSLLPLACLLLAAGCAEEPQPPPQPVAFSHKAHVDNEIACTSCHPGAETEAQAGLTPLAGCATCHRRAIIPDHPEVVKVIELFQNREPLAWNRVNVIPDSAMVHFKHKPHARAEISCDRCHGDVAEMTIAQQPFDVSDMGWCVSCHQQEGASIDCLACHH